MFMKAKWEVDHVSKIVAESFTASEVLRKLGLKTMGGNPKTFKRFVLKHGIDTSHFLGQAHLRGKTRPEHKRIYQYPLEAVLIEDSPYTDTTQLKKRLIRERDWLEVCSRCGTIEWQGEKLSLHLDHINGNNTDHREENLRLLCPNCHSLTPTYCGKNRRSPHPASNRDHTL